MKSKKGLYITLGIIVIAVFVVFAAIGKAIWIIYGLLALFLLHHFFMHGGHTHGGHHHGTDRRSDNQEPERHKH